MEELEEAEGLLGRAGLTDVDAAALEEARARAVNLYKLASLGLKHLESTEDELVEDTLPSDDLVLLFPDFECSDARFGVFQGETGSVCRNSKGMSGAPGLKHATGLGGS